MVASELKRICNLTGLPGSVNWGEGIQMCQAQTGLSSWISRSASLGDKPRMKTLGLHEAIVKAGLSLPLSPPQTAIREITMIWELCVRYANGRETVLDVFQSQAIAQNQVDKLYAEGYPMHFAYFVRPKCAT